MKLPFSPIPVAVIIVLDQLSKQIAVGIHGGVLTLVPELLAVRVIYNRGLLLGLGSGPGGLSATLALLISVSILAVMILLAVWARGRSPLRRLGFACMIGGASGNLLDRLIHGYVIDFIHLRGLPVFNFADLTLVLGTVLVVVDLLRTRSQE